jgi:hypothetical protein
MLRERRASSVAGCHAPASPPKAAQWAEKLLDSWDTAVALSRASLQRRIVAILRTLESCAGTKRAEAAPMSRVGLEP